MSDTICVIGNSRTASDNPITHQFSVFFITFVVESDTGKIIDCEASVTLPLTNRFLKELFLGRFLTEVDQDLVDNIYRRYLGSSQKAVIVAYKDAVKSFARFELKQLNKLLYLSA